MLFEFLSELMTTSWGQVAAIGTPLAVLTVWLLWAWEATVADANEKVAYDRDLPPRPYVKVKSFRTFEKPFQMPKLNEPDFWEVWSNVEWGIRDAIGGGVTMIQETICDFIQWSKENRMFYYGTLGFAGLYYGGVLALTNPIVLGALQSVGTAPYLLLGLILGVIAWEITNSKGYKNEQQQSSVEV